MRGYGQEHEALVAAVWGLGVLEREWGTGGCSGLLPRCMGAEARCRQHGAHIGRFGALNKSTRAPCGRCHDRAHDELHGPTATHRRDEARLGGGCDCTRGARCPCEGAASVSAQRRQRREAGPRSQRLEPGDSRLAGVMGGGARRAPSRQDRPGQHRGSCRRAAARGRPGRPARARCRGGAPRAGATRRYRGATPARRRESRWECSRCREPLAAPPQGARAPGPG